MDIERIGELVPYLRDSKRYTIIKQIGRGGFGTVHLVEDTETGKKLAKKTIPFEDDDPLAGKYFMRELEALLEFRFEGLPFVLFDGFNFPTKKDDAFITTEYIDGGTLNHLIQTKFQSCEDVPTTKMIIIYGIVFAIKLMHSYEIVHRDLKPENILLKNNEPYLADFGFARVISRNNEVRVTPQIGTLLYMAPELFEDDSQLDSSMDVYSFSILLLEIINEGLTMDGKPPCDKKKQAKFIRQVQNGQRYDIPSNDILPDSFRELIENCWDKDPSRRWTMEVINAKLRNGELVLPDCNLDEFNNYISKLDHFYEQCNTIKSERGRPIDPTEPFDFLNE